MIHLPQESHEEDESMHSSVSAPSPALPLVSEVQPRRKSELGPATEQPAAPNKMKIENVNFYYGKTHALKDITLSIPPNQVTAFIGPSGCGKSTLLRTLNRMNDVIPGTRIAPRVELSA